MSSKNNLALFLGLLSLSSCYDPDDYIIDRATASRIMHVTTASDAIAADGRSTAIILAHVDMNAAEDRRKVTFTTSAGSFPDATTSNAKTIEVEATVLTTLDSTRTLVQERVARVRLQSAQQAETALVTAKLAGITDQLVLYFTPVSAQAVAVSATSFFVQPAYKKEVELTATLTRRGGTPTIGEFITFTHTDTLGHSIGRVRPETITSDNQGKGTAIYGLGESTYRGKIRITAISAGIPSAPIYLDILP